MLENGHLRRSRARTKRSDTILFVYRFFPPSTWWFLLEPQGRCHGFCARSIPSDTDPCREGIDRVRILQPSRQKQYD